MMQFPLALALAVLALAPPPAPEAMPLMQVQATDISGQLRRYVAFCQSTARPDYVVDCLSERFDVAADAVGSYGDNAELYRALKTAARDLAAVSRKYASPTARPLVLSATGSFTTSRAIRPVAPENLLPANAAATAVLDEAELTLLRSSSRSTNALAFRQVAEVVGSAKVLLRAS